MPEVDASGDAIERGVSAAVESVLGPEEAAPASQVTPQPEPKPAEPVEEKERLEAQETPAPSTEGVDERVAPLIERIKSGKVSDNDLDMLQRWRRDADEAKALREQAREAERKPAESKEPSLREYVASLVAEYEDGPAYLAQNGPEKTLQRIQEMRAQAKPDAAQPQPEPPKVEQRRELSTPEDLKTRLERLEQQQAQERFTRDLNASLDGIEGLNAEMRSFLADDVEARLWTLKEGRTLREFVEERYNALKPILSVVEQNAKAATLQAAKKKADQARSGSPPTEPQASKPEATEPPAVTEDYLTQGLDRALDRLYLDGGAT